jgi:hypothetical protein
MDGVVWLIRVSVATGLLALAGSWASPGHGETAVVVAADRPASTQRI